MAEFAGEVGADRIRFQIIHLDKDNWHLKLEPEHLNFLRNNHDEIENIARKYDMTYHSSLKFQLSNINEKKGNWSENVYVKKGCYIGWNFSIIKANGELGLCCAVKVIDNINRDGYKNIWNSTKYQSYRIGAKYLRENTDMIFEKSNYHKEEGSNKMFSKKCRHCDNHDLNNYMIRLLEGCNLMEYVGTGKKDSLSTQNQSGAI